MALTVINEPTTGGRLGAAVGTGLAGLIENLVQNKAQQVQQNQRALGYEKAFSLSPEQAKLLASQSDDFQQQAFKALLEAQQNEQLQRQLNPGQFQSPMQPQNVIDQSLGQSGGPSLEQAMGALGGNQEPIDAIAMTLQKALPSLLRQEQLGNAATLPHESPQRTPQAQQPIQTPQPRQGKTVQDIFKERPLNPQLALKAEEINERKRSTDIKERTASYDRVKDDIKKIRDRGETAKRNIHDLELVKKLNKSGQLKQGFKRDLAEKFGLENWYTNEPTEVASKLLERQKSGAASAYGSSRMTNFLLDTYSKQLGRLVNTKEGLDAILDNRINEEKGYELVSDEMARLQRNIEKNKEIYPYDLQNIAYNNMRPKLDALAQQDVKRIDQVIAKDTAQIVKALPAAAAHKGQSKINASRGIRATSDGEKWIITPLE